MDKLDLVVKARKLQEEITRLRADAHDLEGFEQELGRLKHEYADVFASKEMSVRLRTDISDTRARLRIDAVNAAIDATTFELDFSDLQLLLGVTNAFLASPGGSGLLRDNFIALKPLIEGEGWIKGTMAKAHGAEVSRITVSGLDALNLRDALESALVDTSALLSYDEQRLREGEADRGNIVAERAVIQKILNSFQPPTDRALLTPDATEFRAKLMEVLASASNLEFVAVDINAKRFHGLVAGNPSPTYRIPICCKAMLLAMLPGDKVVSQPDAGYDGDWLTIRYRLPRRP